MKDEIRDYLVKNNFKNLSDHLAHAFEFWDYDKDLTILVRLHRTLIFVIACAVGIFWPINDLKTTFLICAISWLIQSFIKNRIPRIITMATLIVSVVGLYDLSQLFLNLIAAH